MGVAPVHSMRLMCRRAGTQIWKIEQPRHSQAPRSERPDELLRLG